MAPGTSGEPAWSYPDTFRMAADAGFWKARFRPLFDNRVETGMISAALKDGLDALASGGESTRRMFQKTLRSD